MNAHDQEALDDWGREQSFTARTERQPVEFVVPGAEALQVRIVDSSVKTIMWFVGTTAEERFTLHLEMHADRARQVATALVQVADRLDRLGGAA